MATQVTDAPGIYVLDLKAGTGVPTGGSTAKGGTVIQAEKGPVGKVVSVTAETLTSIFGNAFSKKDGTKMEGMRHLYDALKDTTVDVVRVVGPTATYPVLVLDAEGLYSGEAQSYGTATGAGEAHFIIYPKDGDPSINRSVAISNVDTRAERFDITFSDVDPKTGATYVLESFTVGVNRNDVDDVGVSAYIETVFETQSDYFTVDMNPDSTWDSMSLTLANQSESVFFQGGSNGDGELGDPSSNDYIEAWRMLRDSDAQILFAGGCYDSVVLAECCKIAEETNKTFVFDVPPYISSSDAADWPGDESLASRQASAYYSPFLATDPFEGGKTLWGVSGEVCAAIARGDAGMANGDTPGVHQSPAGPVYGRLQRTGIQKYLPSDVIDHQYMTEGRVNPIIPGDSGGAIIGDAVTLEFKESYTRFIHVNRIDNYITRQFKAMAAQLKFSPDGITREGIERGMELILAPLVVSGAIVKPRNPEQDGEDEYVYTIEQRKFDLWYVEYKYCPTGLARRIVGQPILLS